MQLTPRHDGPPVLVLEPPVDDPSVLLLRQRRRLAAALAELDDDGWRAQSRCEAWTTKDVIVHLSSADRFWAASIASARRGEPTRYLAGFDPVATPAAMVAASGDPDAADVLADLVGSTEAMAEALAGLDDAGWDLVGEAPPGHIGLRAVVLHALWDGWVHERDVLLPLGLEPVVDADEVAGCLRYGVGLGPAFFAATGTGRTGTYAVAVTDPELSFVVDIGPTVHVRAAAAVEGVPTVSGPAVEVLEGLSRRVPLVHGFGPDDAWMLDGLGTVFDQT